MDIIKDTKIINLDSKNGIKNNSSFLSNIYFQFNGLLKDDPDIIERYISIQNAQIPFSFYNINIYNNVLNLSISSIVYTLILTRGNYNATTLIAEIKNQLNNNGIFDMTIIISEITGIATFEKSTPFEILYLGSTIYNVLGFELETNYTSSSNKIIAPYPLNLLGTLRLRICSFELSTSNTDYVLMTLPIDTGNFSLIQYNNNNNIQFNLNNISLDGFDIEILDDDNNLINFNNINWTMTFLLTITRLKPKKSITNFNEIIKDSQNFEENNINEIQENENNINENDTNENEIQENDNQYFQEPIRDDLDLLLYQNNGNLN